MTIAVRRMIECPTCGLEPSQLACPDGVNCQDVGVGCELEHPSPARADSRRGVYKCIDGHATPMATHVMLELQGAPRLL